MRRRSIIRTSAALWPLFLAGGAWAQSSSGVPVVTAPSDASEVQEVVVTATRQAQTLSKVPISVSAFTEANMDKKGVKSFQDLARYTPGVSFDQDSKTVSIRGISSDAGAGTTGVYIDDTPIQIRSLGFNSNNTLPAVFDLDRVEVLRGPQGTLFGAGSEGGTVRYITPQPSLDRYSGYARAELSGTQSGAPSYEAGAAVGGPIVQDKLGFRISAWARRDGGYVDRVDSATGATVDKNADKQNTTALRGAFTVAPMEGLTLTPGIDYQRRKMFDTDLFWTALSDRGGRDFRNGNPERQGDKDRFYLPTLKAEWDLGKVKFLSNTAYFNRLETVNGYDGTLYNLSYFQQSLNAAPGEGTTPFGDPCPDCRTDLYPLLTAGGINLPGLPDYRAPATITNRQRNFSEEARLQSSDPNGRFNWVAGVFYQANRQRSIEQIHDPDLAAITQYLYGQSVEDVWYEDLLPNGDSYINDTIGHDRQTALFGQVDWAITQQLKLTAGLRFAWTHFDFVNSADGPQNGGQSGGSGKQNEKPLTPKLGLSYQIDPNSMVYASWAKGYRIGGANAPVPEGACDQDLADLGLSSVPDSYKSDTVYSYELGGKSRLFDRRLQVEASAYHIDWKDIQQSTYLPSCGVQYTANLGKAKSDGFDLQMTWRVVRGLTLEGTVGYTHARFTSDALTGGAGSPILAADGDRLGGSPWTATFGAQYDFTVMDRGAYVRADYEFASRERGLTPERDPDTTAYDAGLVGEPRTNFLSLRAGVTLNRMEVSAFMDNVLDSHPQQDLSHQDADTLLYVARTERPRTGGVTLIYRY